LHKTSIETLHHMSWNHFSSIPNH